MMGHGVTLNTPPTHGDHCLSFLALVPMLLSFFGANIPGGRSANFRSKQTSSGGVLSHYQGGIKSSLLPPDASSSTCPPGLYRLLLRILLKDQELGPVQQKAGSQ